MAAKPIELVERILIEAPGSRVWDALADVKSQEVWHPLIRRIEGTHALGAKRHCDVVLDGRDGWTKETCLVRDEGRRIVWRIEEDSSGFAAAVTDFQAGFEVKEDGPTRSAVTMRATFVPKRFLLRLVAPMIRARMGKVNRSILAGLKGFVEADRPKASGE